MQSQVNNPTHYNQYCVECIQVMEVIPDARLANAFKYVWRAGFKDSKSEDIDKARVYLERFLQDPSKAKTWGELYKTNISQNFAGVWRDLSLLREEGKMPYKVYHTIQRICELAKVAHTTTPDEEIKWMTLNAIFYLQQLKEE